MLQPLTIIEEDRADNTMTKSDGSSESSHDVKVAAGTGKIEKSLEVKSKESEDEHQDKHEL